MTSPERHRRDLAACYHEAGHAVVSWVFGVSTHQVRVFATAEIEAGNLVDRKGRPIEGALGLHESSAGPFVLSRAETSLLGTGPEMLDREDVTVEVELASTAAGPAAEGAMTGEGCVPYDVCGGGADLDYMNRLISLWFGAITDDERGNHLDRAADVALAIVESRPGWSAIGHLAAKLAADGIADGRDVDAICETAYLRCGGA